MRIGKKLGYTDVCKRSLAKYLSVRFSAIAVVSIDVATFCLHRLTSRGPACVFFFFFFWGEVEISSRTLIPLFYARISPQWLNEMRRLWSNVP